MNVLYSFCCWSKSVFFQILYTWIWYGIVLSDFLKLLMPTSAQTTGTYQHCNMHTLLSSPESVWHGVCWLHCTAVTHPIRSRNSELAQCHAFQTPCSQLVTYSGSTFAYLLLARQFSSICSRSGKSLCKHRKTRRRRRSFILHWPAIAMVAMLFTQVAQVSTRDWTLGPTPHRKHWPGPGRYIY